MSALISHSAALDTGSYAYQCQPIGLQQAITPFYRFKASRRLQMLHIEGLAWAQCLITALVRRCLKIRDRHLGTKLGDNLQ